VDHKRAFDPFGHRAEAINLSRDGSICVPIPRRIIPFLLGAVNPLRWPDMWTGDAAEINRTTGQVENFLSDLITHADCSVPLPGEPEPTVIDVWHTAGSCNLFQEEFTMPCLDITGLLKIENGILYGKDSCCDWVAIGALEGIEAPVDPGVIDDLLPSGQEYSACGRAYAIWKTINETVSAVWDYHTSWPWDIIGDIKSHSPVNLTTSGVWQAIAQAVIVDVVFDSGDVEDQSKLQNVLCQMSVTMEATNEKLSDAEWDAIKSAYASFGSVTDLPIRNLYSIVLAYAIGRDRLSTVGQSGALNADQDCDCVGLISPYETNPDANGWYLSAPIHTDLVWYSDNSRQMRYAKDTPTHDVYGFVMKLDTSAENWVARQPKPSSGEFVPYMSDVVTMLTGTTSDALQTLNQNLLMVQLNSQSIADSLADQLGYAGALKLVGPVDSEVIASPDAPEPSSSIIGWRVDADDEVSRFEITELRWIHNTNSPSHSA